MAVDMDAKWADVEDALSVAVSIAWDGCHKIYLQLDERQHQVMVEFGYDPLRVDDLGINLAFEAVQGWYETSCSLRFINAVRTVDGNPNDEFITLISQFEDHEDDEEFEDEDDDDE